MRPVRSTLDRILGNAAISLISFTLLLIFTPLAQAQTTTYGVTEDGLCGTVNLTNGQWTQLSSGNPELAGIAEVGANLYGGQNLGPTLYQVDPTTCTYTSVGSGTMPDGYRDFGATTAGALYGIAGNPSSDLYSVDPSTGATTFIGSTNLPYVGGQALSADCPVLYATGTPDSDSVLYLVNTATGAITEIGDTGIVKMDALVCANGSLYGASLAGNLYTLNLTNGQATLVAPTEAGLYGLAYPASTFSVLYNFTNGQDGSFPEAGVTMDSGGNLYGTATAGALGYGTVYKLTHKNGNWTFAPLYKFAGGSDGAVPWAGVVIGPDGSLYGTTHAGGGNACGGGGCGAVFKLQPTPTRPPTPLSPWIETILYSFQGGTDGAMPGYGDLVFDASGAMYNTASRGGAAGQCFGEGCGVVYKMTGSGKNWTQSVIYTFPGGTGPALPLGSVVFDKSGNLYTTSNAGGTNNVGTVIELTPSGGGWTENTIHQFTASTDGASPSSGLILDNSGNLYGTTFSGGPNGGGTVYELIPPGGRWTYKVLTSFTGQQGPYNNLVMDANGNLYGTTFGDGLYSRGSVFELSPAAGGSWTYTDLYDFTESATDGGYPACNLILDANGNLYGTAEEGGTHGAGVVFELTPTN